MKSLDLLVYFLNKEKKTECGKKQKRQHQQLPVITVK